MFLKILIGFIAGIISSMGLGGGSILVLYLTLFTATPQTQAQASNLLYFLPVSLVAVIFHAKNKQIDFKAAFTALPLAVLGALGGAFLAIIFINASLLRIFFAVFILLLGVKEVFSVFLNQDKTEE